jgi:SHS2 domain-containing protein
MHSFEIAPHTADARLRVRGTTLEELFSGALAGMNELMKPGGCLRAEDDFEEWIQISAPDTTVLLVDFLSQVLTLANERRVLFCRVEFRKLRENELEAHIFGTHAEFFERDVKAVTYHEANIVKNAMGNYETNIVFDI